MEMKPYRLTTEQGRASESESLDLKALTSSEILSRLKVNNEALIDELATEYLPAIMRLAREQSRQPDEVSRLVAAGTQGFYEAVANLGGYLDNHFTSAIQTAMEAAVKPKLVKEKLESQTTDSFYVNGCQYRYREPADFIEFVKHNFIAIRGMGEYYVEVVQLLFGLRDGVVYEVSQVAQLYNVTAGVIYKRLANALRGVEASLEQFKFEIQPTPLHQLLETRADLIIYLNQLEQGAVKIRQNPLDSPAATSLQLIDLQRQCGLAHDFPQDLTNLERRIHRKLIILDNFTTVLQAGGHQALLQPG